MISLSFALLSQGTIFYPPTSPSGMRIPHLHSLSYDPLPLQNLASRQLGFVKAVSGCSDNENGLLFLI